MNLAETLLSAGMTPPKTFRVGRWLRFPGVGKGPRNRAGWCRMVTPTLAIYGDFSSNLRAVWTDANHKDDDSSREALQRAREQAKQQWFEERERQRQVAKQGEELLRAATCMQHTYLATKGFPEMQGLCFGDQLLVPVRDVREQNLINVQHIAPDGTKKFMVGGRARFGIHRLGALRANRTLLCEGYATGLSLYEAAKRLWSGVRVVVCFSAGNLECVACEFPGALVCADNDLSGCGERTAKATGLKWVMPAVGGTDFNDLHVSCGLFAVVTKLREATMS